MTFGTITLSVMLTVQVSLSALAFAMFGFDKHQARRHRWRTSESSLLTVMLAGGWLGGWLGRWMFNHKTRKTYFTALMFAVTLISIGITVYLAVAAGTTTAT